MKRKVINAIVDILLIALVFAATDALMLQVLHSENLWLELGVYIVFYAIAFGAKSGMMYLWKKRKQEKRETDR